MSHHPAGKRVAAGVGATVASVMALVGVDAQAAGAVSTTLHYRDSTGAGAGDHFCTFEYDQLKNNNGPNTLTVTAVVPNTEADDDCWNRTDVSVSVRYKQQDSGNYVTQEAHSNRGSVVLDLTNVASSGKIDTTHTITFMGHSQPGDARTCISDCSHAFTLSQGKA